MSGARISTDLRSPITPADSERSCCNAKALKISLFVIGLLLISSAVAFHFLHVNTIAVYAMGGAGGALIIGIMIACAVQCISEYRAEEAIWEQRRIENAETERIQKEDSLWYARAQKGETGIIE